MLVCCGGIAHFGGSGKKEEDDVEVVLAAEDSDRSTV